MELEKGALPGFMEEKAASGVRKADLQTALADAAATYLVGPAYAWATLVIRLDPGAGFLERRAASERVKLMVATLRSHDERAQAHRAMVLGSRR